MKKIITSNIVENVRRQPFNKASFEHIQEAFQEVFADLLKGLTDNAAGVVVLHGCVDSDPDADDYDISAGAVLYNGEVFQVDAFVGSDASDVPVLSLVETYRAGDPVTFSDNNNYNVHQIRKLQWSMATAGSGIADFDELVRFKDVLNPNTRYGGILNVRTKVLEIGDWNMDADNNKVVAHGLGTSAHDRILSVRAIIRTDSDATFKGSRQLDQDGRITVNISLLSSLTLIRETSGIFDDADYDQVPYNRGWIVIEYFE
jgi:hypothetical protein